jgi:hypothetical protein
VDPDRCFCVDARRGLASNPEEFWNLIPMVDHFWNAFAAGAFKSCRLLLAASVEIHVSKKKASSTKFDIENAIARNQMKKMNELERSLAANVQSF